MLAEGEHLAPRRAKLAAYFPEDYKGNEKGEEGAEGEHKNDDPRSVRRHVCVFQRTDCLCFI